VLGKGRSGRQIRSDPAGLFAAQGCSYKAGSRYEGIRPTTRPAFCAFDRGPLGEQLSWAISAIRRDLAEQASELPVIGMLQSQQRFALPTYR